MKYQAGQNYTSTANRGKMNKALVVERDPSDMVMLADQFGVNVRLGGDVNSLEAGHENGYNVMRLDASGAYFYDADRTIESLGGGDIM